jgi:hypothetical protein
MTFLHRQMADYTQKLVVKKPDRVLMDRLSTLIEYVRSLLMQSYKEGIIIPDQMYTTFVEMLPQCPRPEYECLFLSVLLDYAQEMCLVQAGVRKVLQYCLNRMDQVRGRPGCVRFFVFLPIVSDTFVSAATLDAVADTVVSRSSPNLLDALLPRKDCNRRCSRLACGATRLCDRKDFGCK